MTRRIKPDPGKGVGRGPASSSAAGPPRRRLARIVRAAVAALAVVAAVAIAARIMRRGVDRSPTQANREEASGDLEAAFPGPAFSPQATVADLKQAAQEIADELAASYPDSPDSWNVLAQLQFHLGNTPEAIKLWERCLAARPQSSDALYGLGYIAYLEGENAEAVERFRAALATSPDDGRIPLLLAECLTRVGKPEEAVPLLQDCLKRSQGALSVLVLLGQTYLDLGQYENAQAVFEKAAQVDPTNRVAWFGLGTAWARLGNAEKSKQAMDTFKALIADERPLSTARVLSFDDTAKGREVAVLIHHETAAVYLGHGNLQKAEEVWLKASALDPRDVRCRKELAALYERTDRDRSALRVCEQLRDIEPANADYWLNVGVLNARLARYDAALAAVEEAIRLDPANPKYRQAHDVIRGAK